MRKLTRVAALATIAVLVATGSGCGGGDSGTTEDGAQILARAKKVVDRASSVHLVITSADVPDVGTALVGGDGVAARPGKFRGSLKVLFAGSTADVDVVSTDGTVYARLPFSSGFAVTDPAQFGFADPGRLMDPDTGVSTLLVRATDSSVTGKRRLGGEEVTQVDASIPGTVVEDLLASADPAAPVEATFSVARTTGELRRAVLTGPFFRTGVDSTFTITLDRYGAKVDISAPPTG